MVFCDHVVTTKTSSSIKKSLDSAIPVRAEKSEQETPFMNEPITNSDHTDAAKEEVEEDRKPKRGRKSKEE